MTADAPTIPKTLEPETSAAGTTMIFELKSEFAHKALSEDMVLQLCLCLNKLKKIVIAGFTVEISDLDNKRVITINERKHSYYRWVHSFTINDTEAINGRKEGGKEIKHEQQIVCYLPDGSLNEKRDYHLYCGLPTNTRINVPLNIDAPFMLNTSRDYILQDNKWNEIIKAELYHAVTGLIISVKEKLRSSVLRLIGFKAIQSGKTFSYSLNMFDDDALNEYSWLLELKRTQFLPTFDEHYFASPVERCKRYPPVVNYVLRKGDHISTPNQNILDVPADTYDVVLSVLGCNQVNASDTIQAIQSHVDKYIADENYRKMLYPYLLKLDIPDILRAKLCSSNIIPIYSKSGIGIEFVEWTDDRIFTKPNCNRSEESYYVLNESILSKHDCEKIFDVTINEMNSLYENGRYRENLKRKIHESSNSVLYNYLLSEFNLGRLNKYDCLGEIMNLKKDGMFPLKNSKGEITTNELFVGDDESDLFFGPIKNEITVHKECRKFAVSLGYKFLHDIHYDDIGIRRQLNADDIETFAAEYFKHFGEIIGGYVNDDLVCDTLMKEYDLYVFKGRDEIVNLYEGGFPNEKVKDLARLRRYISGKWSTPRKIQKLEETRIVSKVLINGKLKGIDSSELRKGTISRYSPDDGICFCQMCKKPKATRNIEVNNIQSEPRYYWAETRMALCLECSKLFEELRGNKIYYDRFLAAIDLAATDGDEAVDVPIADKSITFTQTHLAEIQEIMRVMEIK